MKKTKETPNNEVILENNKKKKKHSFIYYFLNTLLWVVIGVCVVYSGLNFIDKKTGYTFLPNHTAVVVSGSMSRVHPDNTYLGENDKQIQINDVVISSPISFDDLKYKDVVIYMGEDGVLVCHRVIDKYSSEGNNFVVCRGDANNTDDTPVNISRVRGKITSVIGGIGGFIQFCQSPYFLIALCFGAFFILLGFYIFNYTGKNKKPKKNNTETDNNKVEKNEISNVELNKEVTKTIKCIKCGNVFVTPASDLYICPKCGAKMQSKKKAEASND